MKMQIEQKLVANILIDRCASAEGILFRDAWCTQDRIIRFTLPFFRDYFSVKGTTSRKWGTGDYVMFEICNYIRSLEINCLLDMNRISGDKKRKAMIMIQSCDNHKEIEGKMFLLNQWKLTENNDDINDLVDQFDWWLHNTVMQFQSDLQNRVQQYVDDECFEEGAIKPVTLNRYERNPKARAACLSYYGHSCSVCGINFKEQYGESFAGIIEVHHIVPISQIGESYTVDPVKDLIPVCPNCHTALHSKNDGVYTIEELREIRRKKLDNIA